MTWPLARHLGRDVAADLGDPLYYMWAIAWNCTRLLQVFRGDVTRLAGFFDANIFYPEPLALAHSDHMIAQSLQALPLYALGNVILCYNVIFLSTFVLSGLGMYLFVRELSGHARGAFVAGLLFAFAPYRMGHLAHLNLLSMQWAPLALYGLRRYFDRRGYWPLAGAAAALIVQNLSSGYFVLYLVPFVALYVLWEVIARRVWSDRRLWLDLAAAAAMVAAATTPFLVPYFLLRNRLPALRDVREVARHSADVYAYLTAPAGLDVWGRMLRMYPRPEGELFPGLIPTALAVAALAVWARRSADGVRFDASAASLRASEVRERLARTLLLVTAAFSVLATIVIFLRRLAINLGPLRLSANNVSRLLLLAVTALMLALAVSRRTRVIAARLIRSPEAWAVTSLVGAWALSLGPAPTVFGRPLQMPAPYAFLYDYVPGFVGARAPARLAMVVAFALAVLAGFGLQVIERRWGRRGVVVVALALLVEVSVLPFPVNGVVPLADLATPEPRLRPISEAPEIYRAAGRLSKDAVLVEFPFGSPDYDRRAMYHSILHQRRMINGYSAFYPSGYDALVRSVSDFREQPLPAWTALRGHGVTHALVHEAAYLGNEGARVSEWLRESGATEIFRNDGDALFGLPPR
jgi:hypothetical protein